MSSVSAWSVQSNLNLSAPLSRSKVFTPLAPSFGGGDDIVGLCFPCEGRWVLVVLGDEAVDGGLEVDEGVEDATLEPSPRELGEEPFDGIQPRA